MPRGTLSTLFSDVAVSVLGLGRLRPIGKENICTPKLILPLDLFATGKFEGKAGLRSFQVE